MRILLCVPPFYRFLGSHNNSIHLGLGYLSSQLRREGHVVKQVNFDYLPTNDYANQKKLFEYADQYRLNVHNNYNPKWKEIEIAIEKFSPDIVGISVFSSSTRQVEIIANKCKRLEKKPVVLVGGPMATIAPELLKDIKEFDVIVRGQAESMIGNIVRRDDKRGRGKVYCVPPEYLDALPLPDRHNYLNDYRYLNLSPLITSRGCKFNCKGCAHKIMGGSYRYRSTANVIEEMYRLWCEHDTNFVRIFDDSFTMDRGRVIHLCKAMIKERMDIHYLAETRIDLLDPELLKVMRESGCQRLKVGIESGSKKVLKWLRKGISVKQMERGCKMVKDAGIELTVNTMFGMPDETNKDLQKTIDLCKKIDADYVTISSYVPYPGSEVFDLVPQDRRKEYPYWTHTSRYPVLNDKLDQGLIDDLLNLNEGLKRV